MQEPRTNALDMTSAAQRHVADFVVVDVPPIVLALYRHEATTDLPAGVIAWVIGLPGGGALVLTVGDPSTAPILTTLANVRRRWTRQLQADLVGVTTREALGLVA